MFRNERLELGAERGVAAERQLGLYSLLNDPETELFEPLDLDPRERLELEISQRSATLKRLRVAQAAGRLTGIVLL